MRKEFGSSPSAPGAMIGQSRGGDSKLFLSRSFVRGVFAFISALEVTAARK
jgi:hypothetical protein